MKGGRPQEPDSYAVLVAAWNGRNAVAATRESYELLSVLQVNHREVQMVRGLRWLLDPAEPHGLGHDLVQRLLLKFGVVCPSGQFKVSVEFPVGGGRADLVILDRASSTPLMVLEAKIGAAESGGQVAKYEGVPAQAHVFLSLDGRVATTHLTRYWERLSWSWFCEQLEHDSRLSPSARVYVEGLREMTKLPDSSEMANILFVLNNAKAVTEIREASFRARDYLVGVFRSRIRETLEPRAYACPDGCCAARDYPALDSKGKSSSLVGLEPRKQSNHAVGLYLELLNGTFDGSFDDSWNASGLSICWSMDRSLENVDLVVLEQIRGRFSPPPGGDLEWETTGQARWVAYANISFPGDASSVDDLVDSLADRIWDTWHAAAPSGGRAFAQAVGKAKGHSSMRARQLQALRIRETKLKKELSRLENAVSALASEAIDKDSPEEVKGV